MATREMTINEAENAIQSTLIDLVNSTGRDIELVRVDTRNFANLAVEIILKRPVAEEVPACAKTV